MRWLVDGNNVMGARPDGWWRDRRAAMQRLVSALGVLEAPVTVVFDGKPGTLDAPPNLDVRFARRAGRDAADDEIARLAHEEPHGLTVVTSDATLADRVRRAGARVEGAGTFRRRLDRPGSVRSMSEPRYVLDHLEIAVSDFDAARRFFELALAPLGFTIVRELPATAAFGLANRPSFWIRAGDPGPGIHIAFHGADRDRVDRFHEAALLAGGTDNGAPGLRPHYHPDYYGAYVLDLDGNNVEAVCHVPA